MDDYRRKLEDDLEEAKFALLMDEYAEALGEAYLKEYEQAVQNGGVPDYPEDLKQRCLDMVREYTKAPQTTRSTRALRYVIAVAASIALIFGLLFTVQASGVDVFGALGRWTDSVFHFQTSETSQAIVQQDEPMNEIQKALEDANMPIELAPTWIPEGYKVALINRLVNKKFRGLFITLESENEQSVSLEISEFFDSHYLSSHSIEMLSEEPEVIISNKRQFYLFKNNALWSATWCDSKYCVEIEGSVTKKDVIAMIDSMGELVDE